MELPEEFAGKSVLSQRELDVLSHVCDGKTNKIIARELHISPRTVEDHRLNAFKKLGVHNSTSALKHVMGWRDHGVQA